MKRSRVEEAEALASPLMLWLSHNYTIPFLIGPLLAGGYAVHYYLIGEFESVFALLFYLIIDLYIIYQLFIKKVSLIHLSNLFVLSMFVANLMPIYTTENIIEQIGWFIIFPFFYYNIVGYRKGTYWAIAYYSTVTIIYLIRDPGLEPTILVNTITPTILLSIVTAFFYRSIEKLSIEKSVTLANLNKELSMARQFQNAIFHDRNISVSGFEISTTYRPFMGLGGDIFDHHPIGEKKIRIFMADISGHGVQAALVAMALKAAYDNLRDNPENPDLILLQLNSFFHEHLSVGGGFATAFLADIDSGANEIVYSSAGHPPMMLFDGTSRKGLKTSGLPLGFLDNVSYVTESSPFFPGDTLVFYTDGLTDATGGPEEIFTCQEIESIIKNNCEHPPRQKATAVLNGLEEAVYPDRPQDDIALMIIEYPNDLNKSSQATSEGSHTIASLAEP